MHCYCPLIRYCIVNHFRAYPQLEHTGGFQLLVSDDKSRKKLKVVAHGACSTEEIECFGMGRIYIHPLQESIRVTEEMYVREKYEVCLACDTPVAVSEMHDHQESCEVCIGFLMTKNQTCFVVIA